MIRPPKVPHTEDTFEQTQPRAKLTNDFVVGAIYASTKYTVVAADGDASDGIPGLRGVSQPRRLHRTIFSLGEQDTILQRNNPSLVNTSEGSPYFDRAWTFQEFFLSNRRLIVGNNQFHWTCSSATFHEDLNGADYGSDGQNARFQTSDILRGIPNFRELDGLFSEYNSRNLTFAEDALAGVSGLISVMSRSFEGGFNYGLPEMCFESALIWYQRILSGSGQRRTHSGKDRSILPGSRLPSWSWLGWKTEFGSLSFVEENTGELLDMSEITTCITQWYSHETPHSSTKYAILSKLPDHDADITNSRLNDQIAFEQGWTKEIFDAQKHYKPEESRILDSEPIKFGDFIYQHQRLSGRQFWFPFSLTDLNDMSNMNERPQHPFVSCKTKRGWFQARTFNTDLNLNHPQLVIYGQNGDACGSIYIDSREFVEELSSPQPNQSFVVELVAICKRKTPTRPPASRRKGKIEIREPLFNERYSVLWIQWIDRIAYRKGCGNIRKSSWESHNLEQVDLVLG